MTISILIGLGLQIQAWPNSSQSGYGLKRTEPKPASWYHFNTFHTQEEKAGLKSAYWQLGFKVFFTGKGQTDIF